MSGCFLPAWRMPEKLESLVLGSPRPRYFICGVGRATRYFICPRLPLSRLGHGAAGARTETGAGGNPLLPVTAKAQRRATCFAISEMCAAHGPPRDLIAIGIAHHGTRTTITQASDVGESRSMDVTSLHDGGPMPVCRGPAIGASRGEKHLVRRGRAPSDRQIVYVSPRLLERMRAPTTTCFRGFEVRTTPPQLMWKRLLR
jgi:hypothetical protein